MKYYKNLAKFTAFTLEDAAKTIGSKALASKNLNAMVKNGMVHRIKNNLYTCIDLIKGGDGANRFQIASKITDDSFINYHTAFEFYASYNQMYFTNQVCSTKKFQTFEYDFYSYECHLTNVLEQVDVVQGVRVSTIERTIIDTIDVLGKVMDAEELVKCLDIVSMVDESKLYEMLSIYDKDILYRKAGYILSFYKDELRISEDFFTKCKNKGKFSNKGYLLRSGEGKLVFIPEWGIYGYKDLKSLAYKGGGIDV